MVTFVMFAGNADIVATAFLRVFDGRRLWEALNLLKPVFTKIRSDRFRQLMCSTGWDSLRKHKPEMYSTFAIAVFDQRLQADRTEFIPQHDRVIEIKTCRLIGNMIIQIPHDERALVVQRG